ncbi:MAG TPA: hypothetical protein VIM73_09940, partial [Polyangiaceae bacterium]
IYDAGALACWGRGEHGQLGNGFQAPGYVNAVPTRVERIVGGQNQFVNNASQVVAGATHSCVLASGRVECWGLNDLGQLGEDPALLEGSSRARTVPGLEQVQVHELAAAGSHTCARSEGSVFCWGSNLDGELAIENAIWAPVTEIDLPEPASSIIAGRSFACALGMTGGVHCWGSNYFGERGILENPPPTAPNPLPLEGVTRLFSGQGFGACAETSSDPILCWGSNAFGQLGNGEVTDSPQNVPVGIAPLNGEPRCTESNQSSTETQGD